MELARESEIARRPVVEVVVRHGPQHRDAVLQRRQPRHVLANAKARHARRDGTECAAHFRRGVRLWVPGVELALPAAGEHDQHRLRAAEAGECRGRRGSTAGTGTYQHGGNADAEPVAARGETADGFEAGVEARHGWWGLSHTSAPRASRSWKPRPHPLGGKSETRFTIKLDSNALPRTGPNQPLCPRIVFRIPIPRPIINPHSVTAHCSLTVHRLPGTESVRTTDA